MKKEIIAIIGLGYWGTIVTNTLVGLKLFKKIYIFDSDVKKINLIKKKFKGKVLELSFNKIVNEKKIKNVFLATPPKNNFNILKILINAKKNILVEKPGLTKNAHYKVIKKKLKKNKNKLSFGYIYIYIIITSDT